MPRLTRIYTRTGDDGNTGLADGSRVGKDSARITALGDLDELNSILGIAIAGCNMPGISQLLQSIQQQIFDMGGELAIPGTRVINAEKVTWLEQQLDRLNKPLPPLEEFVLPGGNLPAAYTHHARAVCRRTERSLLQLSRREAVNPASQHYINRLSDLLFVIARTLARQNGGAEITWQGT